jgi:4-hydroxybenzoate polyprenyltransferase
MRLEVPRSGQDFVASLRVGQWAHFGLLPLATFDPFADWSMQVLPAARGVATALCVLAFGYLANALGDRRHDHDPAKNPFVRRSPRLGHYLLVAGLASAGLVISAFGPWLAFVATLVAVVSGLVYSLGPRLKRLPLVGTGLNAACFTPLLFVGIGSTGAEPRHVALAMLFVGLLLQNQLLHEAADEGEDREAGVRTTWIALGRATTAWLAAAIGVVILLLSLHLVALRGAPWILVAHALPYCWIFPRVLARSRLTPVAAGRWRRRHRVAAGASGALLYAISVLC